MSLFVRARPRAPERRLAAGEIPPPGWTGDGNRAVALRVTPDLALRHSAVNACWQKLCNLAALEVHAYRKVGGVEQQVELDPPLLRAPSAAVTPQRWVREVIDAWVTRGTAFGIVTVTDGNGYPTKIELVPPDCVTVAGEGPAAMRRWTFWVDGHPEGVWPNGRLWVAPGPHTKTGVPVGISPIEMALGAIGLGLAAEDYGASWFYSGGHPTGVLQSDQALDQDTATTIKARFMAAIREGGVAALGAGLEYTPVQVAANEAQFIETLDANVATVARFFLVPPETIGASSGNSLTYANVETRQLALLVDTYGPWLSHLEATLNAVTARPQTVRVDVTGLLRLDMRTRTEIDASDIKHGIRSREEIRRTRGLGPVPKTDHIVWPPWGSGRGSGGALAPGGPATGAPPTNGTPDEGDEGDDQ